MTGHTPWREIVHKKIADAEARQAEKDDVFFRLYEMAANSRFEWDEEGEATIERAQKILGL